MRVDAKDYREYLDKEMTIMGILSAVSIAAPAGVLSTVLGEQTGLRGLLWLTGRHFIVLGSVLSVLAALYFYKQRSLLAWYYGQISLSGVLEEEPTASAEVRELIRAADSWQSWWPYSWGFTILSAAFSAYVFAFLFCLGPSYSSSVLKHQHVAKIIALCLVVVVAVVVAAFQRYVLTHEDYKFSEEPWSDFWNALKQSTGAPGKRLPEVMRKDVKVRLAKVEREKFGESLLAGLGASTGPEAIAEVTKRLDAVLEFTIYVLREFLTREYMLENHGSDVYDQFQLYYLTLDRFIIVSEDSDLTKRTVRSSQANRILPFGTFLRSL
jgi:hypothetical protein